MPDEEPGHTYDEVRYEEHRATWGSEGRIIECDECGHLHFNDTTATFEACPIEECDCALGRVPPSDAAS